MEQTERNDHARTMKGIGAAAAAVAAVVALQAPPVAFADTGSGAASGKAAASQDADQAVSPAPAAQAPAQPAGDATAASAHKEAAPASPAGQKGDAAAKDATSSAESDATAAAADLSSGTDGSYEDHGLYLVIVRYVDENGDQIAPSYQTELREGGSWHATSPSIGGYALADASQETLSGTAEGENHSPVYTVVYHSDLATYTVAVELQVGDGYRVARTEQRTARAGARVAAAPEDIAGYHCVTGEADRTTTVTADGKAVIELRYDQDVPSYGVYFETGGSYVAPQTGHAGDALIAPAAPTKPGYSFAGWDLDGDGTTDALPSTIPSYDLTAQAVWAPAQATYQVRYYLQRSGDEYGGEKHYGLSKTRTLTGATESTTPAAERLDTSKGAAYQYYQYACETSAVIAGDGSTIVSVYYDLKPVTVRYYVLFDGRSSLSADELMETRTLNMFQTLYTPDDDAALAMYKKSGGAKTDFYEWFDYYNGLGVVEGSHRLIANGVAFDSAGNLVSYVYATFANGVTPAYVIRSFEGEQVGDYSSPDAPLGLHERGAYYLTSSTYSDKPYTVYEWRCSESAWDGEDSSTIVWGPWHQVDDSYLTSSGLYRFPTPSTKFDVTKENAFEIRYARRSFTVTYYSNGKKVGSVTRRFGEQIAPGEGADASELMPSGGFVFAGWALEPDSTDTVPDSFTVPAQNVSLYAVWKRPDVTVTFDAEGGTPTAAQTIAWGGKASAPAAPVRDGYTFGGWYYFGAGSAVPSRFSFDRSLESNMKLYAAWKSTAEPTAYTVVHVTDDGRVLARETHEGLVGDTVTATPLSATDASRAGYRYVSSTGTTLDLGRSAAGNVITFVYTNDPVYAYVVRAVDAATGSDIADLRCVLSNDALIDVDAPAVNGWRVRGNGVGYVSALGAREVVFFYDRVAAPAPSAGNDQPAVARGAHAAAAPSAVAAGTSVVEERAKHAAPVDQAGILPATGDEAPVVPAIALGAAGAALALGSWRRGKHVRR